jgi:hypothetical protein
MCAHFGHQGTFENNKLEIKLKNHNDLGTFFTQPPFQSLHQTLSTT